MAIYVQFLAALDQEHELHGFLPVLMGEGGPEFGLSERAVPELFEGYGIRVAFSQDTPFRSYPPVLTRVVWACIGGEARETWRAERGYRRRNRGFLR